MHAFEPFLKTSWWRHQMETFSALLAFCAGNSPVPGEFPHKGQCRGALMFSLICAWTNRQVNNREAGDLRRHQAHYDVSVMYDDRRWLPALCCITKHHWSIKYTESHTSSARTCDRPATRKMFPFDDDVIMWRDFVCEESTGHWWIPPQRVSNAVLWCLPCCQFEEAAEQTIKLPVIWDALALMWCHCNVLASTVTRWSLYVRSVHTVKWIPLRPLSLSIGLGSGLSLNTRPAITWSTVRLLMTILLSL